ncbi:MAG: S-adenosylmethionine:tRNA ribosyltransferase-isomerase [Ginsengibacter sp.]
MTATAPSIIQFDLPPNLACPKPTEERKIKRDEVRLLVTTKSGSIGHTIFNHLTTFLKEGDVLVVNTSATIPSALPILLPNDKKGKLHFSTKLNDKQWLVEIREITGNKTKRWKEGKEEMVFHLPTLTAITLKQKFYKNDKWLDLWIAEFNNDLHVENYLEAFARPIQYEHLEKQYPLSYYQTFFSFHPGSSEMPSAGRGFTPGLIERLLKKGIVIVPVLLHTGVSSLEEYETPYPEYMEIDPVAAAVINTAKRENRRIIGVGTTVVRAVESAANEQAIVTPSQGKTELFIDENYSMKIINGLLTGFHEPKATHLNMLQAIAGYGHIERAYHAAIEGGYYWHQFGDLHLILP